MSSEPGKLADIVVLEKDPLEEVRNTESVRWVMMNGRLFDAADLTEIHPRERALDFRGFVEEAPGG